MGIFRFSAFPMIGKGLPGVALAIAAACLLLVGRAGAAGQFSPYVMDHRYFSCEVPSGWGQEREADRDEEYRIFEIRLVPPRGDREPVAITVSYYAKDNEDFRDHADFLARNSRNALGETDNKREHYGPVKETALAGHKAFELERERLVYLHPESKSDESVAVREFLYVAPSPEGGFHVLHYSAPKSLYDAYLPVFRRVVSSFRGVR